MIHNVFTVISLRFTDYFPYDSQFTKRHSQPTPKSQMEPPPLPLQPRQTLSPPAAGRRPPALCCSPPLPPAAAAAFVRLDLFFFPTPRPLSPAGVRARCKRRCLSRAAGRRRCPLLQPSAAACRCRRLREMDLFFFQTPGTTKCGVNPPAPPTLMPFFTGAGWSQAAARGGAAAAAAAVAVPGPPLKQAGPPDGRAPATARPAAAPVGAGPRGPVAPKRH